MPHIEVTQYLLPDGRTRRESIDRPQEVADLAAKVIAAGFRFEAEVLHTGQVSLTVVGDEGDVDIEVVENGPGVPEAFDRLVRRVAATVTEAA